MSMDASFQSHLQMMVICITVLTIFLPVKGSLYIEIDSNAVGQGTYARFVCLVRGSDRPAMVRTWLKNGHTLQSNIRASTLPPPYYNQLVIRNAQPTDAGMYTCVTNEGQNSTQYLVVYCPIVTYPRPVVRAVIGGNATLRCDGECYDYIFWSKNNYIIDSIEPERFYSPGNGSALYITNVTMSDNGTFLCEFISMKTAYRAVELLVVEAADQVTVSRSNSVASVGHDYEIRCESNGHPRPESVSWFNDSKPISSTNRVSMRYRRENGTATLSISPLTHYDLSKLECRFKQTLLEGQINYINAVISITATDKPDPPTDLHTDVVVSSDVSVKLKVHLFWTPPIYTGNSQMLAYRVTYWDENRCQRSLCKEEYWMDGSAVSHQFDLLRYDNHSRVCFSVKSVNREGLSDPSKKACVGSRRYLPKPTSPAVVRAESATLEGLASETRRPFVRRTFQVALKAVGSMCSGFLKVSERGLTRALTSLFIKLCSCSVEVTADSYALLGRVVYYRGSLMSSQADLILNNLSHHIQQGSERLRLSDSQLEFITNCPIRVSNGICRISPEDSSLVNCIDSSQSTNGPLPETLAVSKRQSLSQLGITVCVLGGLLVAILFVAVITIIYCRCTRVLAGDKAKCKRTSSTPVLLHHDWTTVPVRCQSQVSISRTSPSSSDVTNEQQLMSSKRMVSNGPTVQCGHLSHDSVLDKEEREEKQENDS